MENASVALTEEWDEGMENASVTLKDGNEVPRRLCVTVIRSARSRVFFGLRQPA